MKIAFVFDDTLDNPDGVQQYIMSLAGYYSQQGHEVHYLVGQTVRTDIPNVHVMSRNVKVRFNGNRLSIPLWAPKKRVKQLLQQEQFDVLHIQAPYHPLMAGRIVRAAGPNTFVFGTFHVAPYSRLVVIANYLLGLWSRPSLRQFDLMTSVSTAAQELCRKTFRLNTRIVSLVFDYQRFNAAQPLARYSDNVKTIVFLGRLVPRKGCAQLLRAIAQLQSNDSLPQYRVVVCGGGPLKEKLQAYVAEHNLNEIVQFAGFVSEADKPRYLASADIAVFPSSAGESFGIVLIEAMASGRAAVLGGNNPGYRSVLAARPEQLFSIADDSQLVERLIDLLKDDDKRLMAAAWGMHDSKQYDVTLVGAHLLQLYETGVQNSRNK